MEEIFSTIYWIGLGYGAMLLLILSCRPSKKTRPWAKRIGDNALMITYFFVFIGIMFFPWEKIIWVVIGFSLAGGTVAIIERV
jgi:hypothetical protein